MSNGEPVTAMWNCWLLLLLSHSAIAKEPHHIMCEENSRCGELFMAEPQGKVCQGTTITTTTTTITKDVRRCALRRLCAHAAGGMRGRARRKKTQYSAGCRVRENICFAPHSTDDAMVYVFCSILKTERYGKFDSHVWALYMDCIQIERVVLSLHRTKMCKHFYLIPENSKPDRSGIPSEDDTNQSV